MPDTRTAQDFLDEQAKEYGQYVALQPILHNGVRAYQTGEPVPASNVEAHGYLEDGLVARVTTKAAKAVTDNPEKV